MFECHYLTFGNRRTVNTSCTAGRKETIMQQVITATPQCFTRTARTEVDSGGDGDNNNNNVTVLWNQAVHTDREVTANRPDIIIKNKKEETCTPIDVGIPADRNVVQKEAEKKLKNTIVCI